VVEISCKEECAVVKNAIPAYGGSIPGYFSSLKRNIAAGSRFGRNTHLLQGLANSLAVKVEPNRMSVFNECHIQIAFIVVNGTAS